MNDESKITKSTENRYTVALGDVSFVLKHYLRGYDPGFIEDDRSGLFHKRYFGYNPDKYYSSEGAETPLESVFNSAETILDLGSGKGDSVHSILKFIPNARNIYTVDSEFSSVSLSTAIPHTHFQTDIKVFLKDITLQSDIVIMRGVPTHHLEISDYDALFTCVALSGFVLEFGDTRLNVGEMSRVGFEVLLSVETIAPRGEKYYDRIWQKKQKP